MKNKRVIKFSIMIISVIAAITVVILVYTGYYRNSAIVRTHERVSTYINEALQYNESEYDLYLAQMDELLSLPYISDSDKGHIYERMAQIHKFKGDTLSFYHTMGNALYYLEKSGNKSIAVNIYEDIANYYITDCNYEQADKILQNVYSMGPLSEIDDPQVRSYAYRIEAILARQAGDTVSAMDNIAESDRILETNTEQFWYASYVAINDAVRAGILLDDGKITEARDIIEMYKDSDFFSVPIYADIMTRDFVLPYYETACKLAAYEGNDAYLLKLLDRCSKAGSQYGFKRKVLSIILDILNGDYDLSADTQKLLNEETLLIYSGITKEQSDEYAAMINSPLENGIQEQRDIEEKQHERTVELRIFILAAFLSVIIIIVLVLVIRHSLTDPLTGIGNRRALDHYLLLLRLFGINIHALMIDADDFKNVNDTYGHDQGDVVLKRIGSLLKAMQTVRNRGFRYGGEEFVMVIKSLDRNTALRIAENIRRDMEWQTWDFPRRVTVSIGVSSGNASMDTVRLADECMYHSKANGKNAVSYESNGRKMKL
jgi:diguanylate cyclase (GGDEF)-like protein